ncbi:MAG: cystathionine beta-lyase [Hyphomicrobium sp.]|nr:cystathionine beta-lyase [Hyphomicrobium sp.]
MSKRDAAPSSDSEPPHHPETDVVHAGRAPHDHMGFVNIPPFRGSTVLFPTLDALEGHKQPFTYGRRGTPTVKALEEALAHLEGGHRARLVSSGYQAVTTAILAFAEAGDHILITDSVYQPTRHFADTLLKRLGVETEYYDPLIGADIATLFRPNTRLVLTESPGSQTFEVQDIPAITAAARERGIWVLMDNTWATPLFFQPFRHGVDVSIHAATKYIVGHADALLGVVTSNARAAPHVERAAGALGVCPGSEETYLGARGLRTLAVRLARHQENGIQLATWLAGRSEVARVLHPALATDPGHTIWARDFMGASGLFSVVLKPCDRAALARFLDGLTLFAMGYSWGGYESLILPFDCTGYRSATRWKPEGPALRIHAGLENADDLIADLARGFERLGSAT